MKANEQNRSMHQFPSQGQTNSFEFWRLKDGRLVGKQRGMWYEISEGFQGARRYSILKEDPNLSGAVSEGPLPPMSIILPPEVAKSDDKTGRRKRSAKRTQERTSVRATQSSVVEPSGQINRDNSMIVEVDNTKKPKLSREALQVIPPAEVIGSVFLSEKLGISKAQAIELLQTLYSKGKIVRVSRGMYRLADPDGEGSEVISEARAHVEMKGTLVLKLKEELANIEKRKTEILELLQKL